MNYPKPGFEGSESTYSMEASETEKKSTFEDGRNGIVLRAPQDLEDSDSGNDEPVKDRTPFMLKKMELLLRNGYDMTKVAHIARMLRFRRIGNKLRRMIRNYKPKSNGECR